MGFFEVGIALYIVSIVAALTMTWAEQRRSVQTNWVLQTAGYVACTVWPLIAVVFMFMRVTARA